MKLRRIRLFNIFAIILTVLQDYCSLGQCLNSAQTDHQKVLSDQKVLFWYAMTSQNAANKIILMQGS